MKWEYLCWNCKDTKVDIGNCESFENDWCNDCLAAAKTNLKYKKKLEERLEEKARAFRGVFND